MFKNAIVRRPCKAIANGITSAPELGRPDYELALRQHDAYIVALERCGVRVTVLEALDDYPDSCFVEDVAILTRKCAIVTNPGAMSRNGEPEHILPTLETFFAKEMIGRINAPGTMEGGDVMMVGDHFYVGRSARTNDEGIRQFVAILEKHGLTGSKVPLEHVLHLKTGINYIENNNMLISGEFVEKPDFASFNRIDIPKAEVYAANCIWMNDKVIVPAGYPTVESRVREAGYEVIPVDTSEYRKIDGGLSCLSLRF